MNPTPVHRYIVCAAGGLSEHDTYEKAASIAKTLAAHHKRTFVVYQVREAAKHPYQPAATR